MPSYSRNESKTTHLHHSLVLSTVRPPLPNKFVWLKLGMSMIITSLVVVPVIQNGKGQKFLKIIIIVILINVRSIFFPYMA